jgi:hypothetical protein
VDVFDWDGEQKTPTPTTRNAMVPRIRPHPSSPQRLLITPFVRLSLAITPPNIFIDGIITCTTRRTRLALCLFRARCNY